MAVPLTPSFPDPAETDPNRRALASIDAVHDADPADLNEPVARLRRFVRLRRLVYYSVLAPVAFSSRVSALAVLISGVVAAAGALVALFADLPLVLVLFLMYWALAALSYHALSVRMAALLEDAADSVGWTSADVLARWRDD